MQKIRAAVCFCGFVAIGILFAGATTAEPLNAPQWHFSATFPCQSQISGQSTDTAVGRIVLTMYACGDDSEGYMVGINDYPAGMVKPENVDGIYAGVINGAATSVKGSIRGVTVYTLANLNGREVVIDIPNTKGVLKSHVFLVGDRLYQVTCFGNAETTTGQTCKSFLDSFTLIGIDALTNPASPPSK
jgi:hypothetical protein